MKSVKKLVLSAMAVTMMFGSVAANATTDINGLGNMNAELGADGRTSVPTISITVPTSATFIINPFEMEVGEGDEASSEQVISTDIEITSASDVAVDVFLDGYTAQLGNESKIVLATAPILPTTTSVKNDLFLWMDNVELKEGQSEKTFDSKVDAKKVVKASATGLKQPMGTLAASTGTVKMKFYGNANAKGAWTEADTITVTPTFKFEAKKVVAETPQS